ncbi:MAG: GNAT family N-acetyltransferase [Bacilli bacterium]|jgi:GNAT superfamily N-acetyltransferase|nr:GNAT family N-acetyltransferase [Bacilli bacterium]MDY0363276.1 GNAT family N-acetyltransferase [Bacilli bacterium]
MIRSACYNDLNEIISVINDAKNLLKMSDSDQWQDTDGYPNINTFKEDLKSNYVYVLEEEDVIVGVVVLSFQHEDAYDVIEGKWNYNTYSVIHRLAVKNGYYGKKIGYRLIEYCYIMTKKKGLESIRVDTHEKNITMQVLLEKIGFINCGYIFLNRKGVLNNLRIAYEIKVE